MIDDGGLVYPGKRREYVPLAGGGTDLREVTYPGITRRDDMIKTFIAAMLSNPSLVNPALAEDFLNGERHVKSLMGIARNMADEVIAEGRKGGE